MQRAFKNYTCKARLMEKAIKPDLKDIHRVGESIFCFQTFEKFLNVISFNASENGEPVLCAKKVFNDYILSPLCRLSKETIIVRHGSSSLSVLCSETLNEIAHLDLRAESLDRIVPVPSQNCILFSASNESIIGLYNVGLQKISYLASHSKCIDQNVSPSSCLSVGFSMKDCLVWKPHQLRKALFDLDFVSSKIRCMLNN